MPKYKIYGVVTSTKFIGEFEADSKEDAERMAWDSDESDISVCWHCEKEIRDPEIKEMIIEEE